MTLTTKRPLLLLSVIYSQFLDLYSNLKLSSEKNVIKKYTTEVIYVAFSEYYRIPLNYVRMPINPCNEQILQPHYLGAVPIT